ncbi:MAG: hypothetical protein HYR90_04885 [Candidatus Andersenbacteria bacterium]|nr:hypothetical protein [Candidatus Andersenbacteria bacterium]MBI3250776.1 hypothetical protein [Candidatus Andersenbacteria bacterium]
MLYAVAERGAMKSFQRYKDRFFLPLVRTLAAWKITANHISFLSGLVAASGLLGALLLHEPTIFLIGLWVHVLLDGIDGALARWQKTGPTGVLVDTAADMVGIASACLYAFLFAHEPYSLILIFFATYASLVFVSLIRDARGFPYTFTVRPRFFVYFFLTLDYALSGKTAGLIMGASAIPMGMLVLAGMYAIWRRQSRAR